jgi:hypothetical protein
MKISKFILCLIVLSFSLSLLGQSIKVKGKHKTKNLALDGISSSINKSENQFDYPNRVIFEWKHRGNKLVYSYFENEDYKTHKKDSVFIPHKSFYAVSEWKRGLDASVINIPFKIRPKIDSIPSNATADIKNIGLFLGSSFTSERYFYNGKSSIHKIAFGGFLSPTLIGLNLGNTNGRVGEGLNQLGISLGGGINYTYKSISFVFIPFGFDFGLSSESKDWIYHGKYWFGFGIGIDTTLLSF